MLYMHAKIISDLVGITVFHPKVFSKGQYI